MQTKMNLLFNIDLKKLVRKYVGKKCIDVMKRLRPRVGFYFDIQYVKKNHLK